MFEHVQEFAGDPILTLNEQFNHDKRAAKVNLSIGVYLDDNRCLPRMAAVAKSELAMALKMDRHPYLPMEGAAKYRIEVQGLLLGKDSALVADQRVVTVQTIGGSGALKTGADFLHAWFGSAGVWVSDPTWDNHWGIFSGAGFKVDRYPYYDPQTRHVDFSAMCAALESIPKGDIVVLHACCHNPTGADLSELEWEALAELFQKRSLIPFFDIAYQGFGRGVDEDAFAVRHFASRGIPLFVASSFSKNFSLYGERCGALHVICPDSSQAENVLGQLKATVRRNYSSPPAYGSKLIAGILADPWLRQEWDEELAVMRRRIITMRTKLYMHLVLRKPSLDFNYLIKQQGMFSYTGLTPNQVRRLRDEHGVYLIESGRICMAALTEETLAPVAEAIASVVD